MLEQLGGRCLAPEVSALGSIPTEVNAKGIEALARTDFVRAILEDQPIRILPRPKR